MRAENDAAPGTAGTGGGSSEGRLQGGEDERQFNHQPTNLLDVLMDGQHPHSLCAKRRGGKFHTVGVYTDAEELRDTAAHATSKGLDVWFGVHPLDGAPERRGGNDAVAVVRVIPVDLDWDDPTAHSEKIELPTEQEVRDRFRRFTTRFPTTCVVESGHGFQAYWALSHDVDVDLGSALISAMHKELTKAQLVPDRGDLAAVLRVPGSINFKAEPIEVRAVHFAPEIRLGPEWLQKQLGVTETSSTGRRTGSRGRWRELDRSALHEADLAALELLEEHGGRTPFDMGDGTVSVTRPGVDKAEWETSMSIGYHGPGRIHCFTTGWPPFKKDATYDLGEARELLRGAGDGGSPSPVRVWSEDTLADGHRATDSGNADRFIALADGRARYVPAWGKWVIYSDGRWVVDPGDALATELARAVPRAMFELAAQFVADDREPLWKHARKSEQSNAIKAMLHLARGAPGIVTEHERFDVDPWVLNVQNGTIDLRTGRLRPHDPDDLLTMQAPVVYDPRAAAPLWRSCLERWQPDEEMRSFLQRTMGTAITGLALERILINIGAGGNGKGKFFGAIANTIGPYATVAHKSLLVAQRNEQHATVKASLFRVRLALAAETRAGDRLDEEQIKELTGGDVLRARRMREDEWSFKPTHTLVMHTNYRPSIAGTDEGIWRRLLLIPWNVTIPKDEQDAKLAERLEAEAPGILRWLIEGAVAWQEKGLVEPAAVTKASADYRSDEDVVGRFIGDECVKNTAFAVQTGDLRDRYVAWCRAEGEEPKSPQALGRDLTGRGFVGRPGGGGRRFWHGLALVKKAEDATGATL